MNISCLNSFDVTSVTLTLNFIYSFFGMLEWQLEMAALLNMPVINKVNIYNCNSTFLEPVVYPAGDCNRWTHHRDR